MSEDCLTLNIWTSQSQSPIPTLKPVLFWIFGGNLVVGSTFQPQYDGSVLATQDVVVVSVNYRLGLFGFLYGNDTSAPGNAGLYDQILALQWVCNQISNNVWILVSFFIIQVRNNIYLFGGDKNQITIFGQNSGAISVSAHLLSPLSNGLFKRAIVESSANLWNKLIPPVTLAQALLQAQQIAIQLNCTDPTQWLNCLRLVNANALVKLTGIFSFPLDHTEVLPFSAQDAFANQQFNKGLLAITITMQSFIETTLVQ